jgi:hypothetical protein
MMLGQINKSYALKNSIVSFCVSVPTDFGGAETKIITSSRHVS